MNDIFYYVQVKQISVQYVGSPCLPYKSVNEHYKLRVHTQFVCTKEINEIIVWNLVTTSFSMENNDSNKIHTLSEMF